MSDEKVVGQLIGTLFGLFCSGMLLQHFLGSHHRDWHVTVLDNGKIPIVEVEAIDNA